MATIKKKQRVLYELKNKFVLYLLVFPAVVYTFVYGYATMPYMIIAFERYNYKQGLASPFIGFTNFIYFFKSNWAWIVTRNTILLNFLFIISVTVCAIVMALLLNEARKGWFLKVSQTAMLFPYFISWVVVSYIMESLLSFDTGLFNKILGSMGRNPISFYSESKYWYVILVLVRIWKTAGYTSIIYLAVITGIDESLYEAAYIDGASRFQRTVHITLPLLFPTVIILILMSIGQIFYGDFGMFYAIIRDNGSLMPMAEVIDTYVFRMFRYTGDSGKTMAIGLYQSVVGFALVYGCNTITRKFYPEGSLF